MGLLTRLFRIRSSVPAAVALVGVNLIPLFGVLFLGWDLMSIIVLYWLENGVIGVVAVLKIALAQESDLVPSDPAAILRGRGLPRFSTLAKAGLIPFFVFHYGLFWVVHGVFVFLLPVFAADLAGAVDVAGPSPAVVAVGIVALAVSHGLSFLLNYVGRREYRRVSPGSQMAAPYGRVVVLHVTILVGAFAIAAVGAPIGALAVLVVMKTLVDLVIHLAQHRGLATVAGTG